MPLTVINGPTIAAGETLSDVVDCTGGQLVRITMPAEWSSAMLTFQLSSDDVGYNDLYDTEGNLVAIMVVPGYAVLVPSLLGNASAFMKFRSSAPQAEQRTFAVALAKGQTAAELPPP